MKRLELALEGMAPVARTRPGLRLLVLGGVLDAEYAARLIRRMEQLPWVVYAGEIPHCEVASWLGLADAVLNTSASEGQPQAALEAMSLGKPAVMTAVVGNLGVMEPGREGFYVHDAQELAAQHGVGAQPLYRRR
ncbi:MAG: glycosyltransferase, partial [Syntrophomonadaceae bacterium]|nr:glycosyltransferase [Syntrophomonadaceae bacterium]